VIAFNEIPNDLLIPVTWVEFDATRANQGPAIMPFHGLIFSQKLAAGTGAVDTLHLISNADQAGALAGRGSLAHEQAKAWFSQRPGIETWLMLVADHASGTAATKTILVANAPTSNGTFSLYLEGTRISVAVLATDDVAGVAAKIKAEIDLYTDLQFTATVSTATVTLTARNKGEAANSFDVRHSFQPGEYLPAGLALTIANGVTGATNPVLTSAIAALGDEWFNVLVYPWVDATSLTAIETELASRFTAQRSIDGYGFGSSSVAYASLVTLGGTRNSPHHSVVAAPGDSPLIPPWQHAAMVAAQAGAALKLDPARPVKTLELIGGKQTATTAKYTDLERNSLLQNGISTTVAAAGGKVRLEQLVTTYSTNAAGAPDTAYQLANTMFTLAYLRYSFRNRMATRYPRHKLADDGTRADPGQPILTPSGGKAEALMWFREMEGLGLVEGYEQFEAELVVERNETDANRLDFLMPPDLMNQLIVTAARMQFLI